MDFHLGLSVLVGLALVIWWNIHRLRQDLRATDGIFLTVYLVLRSNTDPANLEKQWLLSRFCRFRVVPRVGDTLHLENGQYPVVTEVQLRTDRTCTVWCDVDLLEDELDKTAAECSANGWCNDFPEAKFHHAIMSSRLALRSGSGFDRAR